MESTPPYMVIDGIELNDVARKVNDLIAQGYAPQPMVVAPPTPGAQSRPRYVVPMVLGWLLRAKTLHAQCEANRKAEEEETVIETVIVDLS